MKISGSHIGVLVVGVVLGWFLAAAVGNSGAAWTAFYYPNRDDLDIVFTSVPLKSLEECQNWVRSEASRRPPHPENGYDYECGVKCRYDWASNFGINICKEIHE